jgi:3-polyprenyl-4-hydroxybenzoate decarboxylase
MLFRTVFALLVVSATAFTASKPTLVRPVSFDTLSTCRHGQLVVLVARVVGVVVKSFRCQADHCTLLLYIHFRL